MARTDLSVQTTDRDGIVVSYTEVLAANDCMFPNDGKVEVRVANASGSTANLVFETPATVLSDELAIADKTGTVADGTEKVFGPFPTATFNQPSGADVGKLYLDTDQTVSVAVVKLGALA